MMIIGVEVGGFKILHCQYENLSGNVDLNRMFACVYIVDLQLHSANITEHFCGIYECFRKENGDMHFPHARISCNCDYDPRN